MSVVSGQSNGTVEVTPSGIPVYYQSQPKRLYRVGWSQGKTRDLDPLDALLEDAKNDGEMWREVPSVTSVLGVLDKSGLPYWGNKVGVDGIIELVQRGLLIVVTDGL